MDYITCIKCGRPPAFPQLVKAPWTCISCKPSEQLPTAATGEPKAAVPVDVVRRQWCIEMAIKWAGRPDDQTQTDEMIDMAAMIDRFIMTGAHSKMIELTLLEQAMNEAERSTKNVSLPKAKAVCDEIMQRVIST